MTLLGGWSTVELVRPLNNRRLTGKWGECEQVWGTPWDGDRVTVWNGHRPTCLVYLKGRWEVAWQRPADRRRLGV